MNYFCKIETKAKDELHLEMLMKMREYRQLATDRVMHGHWNEGNHYGKLALEIEDALIKCLKGDKNGN